MDFFKSVFSNDPDPSNPPRQTQSPSESPHNPQEEEDEQGEEEDEDTPDNPNPSPASGGGGGAWNFGGLIKTFASKSESVIQTYRRDLEEFSSGLKKETAAIKEVATRAVRDLPGSLEVGASVAQESLESVGQAIDDFGGSVWRGTAEIISHGKEALLSVDSDDPYSSDSLSQNPSSSSKRYSRFEVQVIAIQNDANTFMEEPEDGEDFKKWKLGFKLEEEEEEEEIENLLYENGVLEGFFEKFVPSVVDRETFFSRYFYKVYKLKQAENARANLVKRVISREEEEELTWEVDDDDEVEENYKEIKEVVEEAKGQNKEGNKEKEEENGKKKEIVGTSESVEEKQRVEATKKEIVEISEEPTEDATNKEIVEISGSLEEKKPTEASQVEYLDEADNAKPIGVSTSKIEDKMPPEAKSEPGESCKDSDFSVVSSQPSMQEEDDLGWDEIEDLGEHDDKKVGGSSGSPKIMDLRKKLSAAEEDEDLSWDIEDDDEPMKP